MFQCFNHLDLTENLIILGTLKEAQTHLETHILKECTSDGQEMPEVNDSPVNFTSVLMQKKKKRPSETN